jgi:nucleotide-binding universal stress UspA family protein
MWKTILFAHDFSGCAAGVESTVAELAMAVGAEVVVCHVSDLGHGLPPDTLITPRGETQPRRLDDFTLQAAGKRLDEIAARFRARGLGCRTAALLGPIPKGILRAAKEQSAGLIAMGTHGRTGLDHLILGSVAEKVLREADVPVMTLRTPAKAVLLFEDELIANEQDG